METTEIFEQRFERWVSKHSRTKQDSWILVGHQRIRPQHKSRWGHMPSRYQRLWKDYFSESCDRTFANWSQLGRWCKHLHLWRESASLTSGFPKGVQILRPPLPTRWLPLRWINSFWTSWISLPPQRYWGKKVSSTGNPRKSQRGRCRDRVAQKGQIHFSRRQTKTFNCYGASGWR